MSFVSGLKSTRGIAMSADTQESLGEDKYYCEKLEVKSASDDNHLVIGGAGRGELTEAFIEYVGEQFAKDAPRSEADVKTFLDEKLRFFYENDVRLFPGRKDSKTIRFLIAVQNQEALQLWKSSGARVTPVSKYAVVGYNTPSCMYTMKRLHRTDLPLTQLVFLSIYLVAIAKSSARNVGFDTKVIVLQKNKIEVEELAYIELIDRISREYERRINGLLLACVDTNVAVHQLKQIIAEFSAAILPIHKAHIDATMAQLSWKDFFEGNYKRPLGVNVGFGYHPDGSRYMEVEHDSEKNRAVADHFKMLKKLGDEMEERLDSISPGNRRANVGEQDDDAAREKG